MDELINIGGTGQACPICGSTWDIGHPPFASDTEAVTHIATHAPTELAWALLTERATVQRFLVAVDEGDLDDERDAEELLREVEYTASQSPGRPQ